MKEKIIKWLEAKESLHAEDVFNENLTSCSQRKAKKKVLACQVAIRSINLLD